MVETLENGVETLSSELVTCFFFFFFFFLMNIYESAAHKSDILRIQANPSLRGLVLFQALGVAATPSPRNPVTLKTCPI
jgi:hypothetical protein